MRRGQKPAKSKDAKLGVARKARKSDGARYWPRANSLPQVHRTARRQDLGEEPDPRGLYVHVHDPLTYGRVSASHPNRDIP